MDSQLYDAAKNGDVYKLKRLTATNPNILLQISRAKKETVLHVVASGDHPDAAAEFICKHCPELIQATNSKGDSVFHIAVKVGHTKLLELLIKIMTTSTLDLEEGGCTDAKQDDHQSDQQQQNRNVLKRMQIKLDEEDATARDAYKFKKSLLMLKNKNGNTVLHEAVRRNYATMVEMLMKEEPHLADCVNESGESAIYMTADLGLLAILKIILGISSDAHIASVSHRGPNGQTALHVATARGHIEIAKELARHRKELVKEKDNDGRTPLHYAASFGHLTVVSYFMEVDSSCVYFKDKDGHSAIHVAAFKGRCNIIEQMTNSCSDAKDLLNREDQNVLHIAAKYGKEKVTKFLLHDPKFKLLINEKDKKGNSPLHLAARHWHPNIVSLLTGDGRVDMGIINKKGLTALDVAEEYIDTPASFRKLITLAALRVANAPFGRHRLVIMEDVKKDKMMESEAADAKTNQVPLVVLEDKKDNVVDDTTRIGYYKDRVNTFILVATLIATVTFAAGFTMPGGYHSDDGPNQGMAILLTQPSFYLCVVCNTVAMYTSIIIIITLMWAQTSNLNSLAFALQLCSPLLGFALISMAAAFATGLYSVVSKLTWFGSIVLAMGFTFIICISYLFFALHVLLWSKYPRLLYWSQHFVNFLIFFTKTE